MPVSGIEVALSSTPLVYPASRRVPVMARRPEVLPMLASGLAWTALVVRGGHQSVAGHAGHAETAVLMSVAAMAPLSIPLVRLVASGTPWWLAGRAVTTAFGAFVGVWAVMALALHGLAEAITLVAFAPLAAAVLAGVCALATFRRRRSERLLACLPKLGSRLASPLSESAWRGTLAALLCAQLCLGGMLAMLLVPEQLGVMAALTGIALAERAWAPSRRGAVAAAYAGVSASIFASFLI